MSTNRVVDETSTRVGEILEEVLACEMLEYHNANWLDGDPKQRSERKMESLREALVLLGHSTPEGW